MLIGYLRSGAAGRHGLAAHRRVLGEAGCERVVEDLVAERRRERPELHRVVGALQPGDVLVVPELGCLGRSLPEVVQRMQQVSAAGAGLRSLQEALDTTTQEGKAMAGMIGGLAGLGRWIEGQADRAEGRRILAALPRLVRGEGWVWAPSHDVLEKVAFPRIRTSDSSATPRREEKASTPRTLASVDLATLTAALVGAHVHPPNELAPPAPGKHSHALGLERQLRQCDAELATARAELSKLEAQAAQMRARLNRTGGPNGRTPSAIPSVK